MFRNYKHEYSRLKYSVMLQFDASSACAKIRVLETVSKGEVGALVLVATE